VHIDIDMDMDMDMCAKTLWFLSAKELEFLRKPVDCVDCVDCEPVAWLKELLMLQSDSENL